MAQEERQSVVIGRFRITESKSAPDHVWIQAEDGEGGRFAAADLEKYIEAFYKEKF